MKGSKATKLAFFTRKTKFWGSLLIALCLLVVIMAPTLAMAETKIRWIAHPVHYKTTGDGQLLDEFRAKTGIEVIPALYGVDVIIEKSMMELMAGSGMYDVITLSNTMWRTDLGSQAFVNLEPRFKEIKDFDDFIPGLIETFRAHDGTVVSLPIRSGAEVMHYRQDLFEKYGVPVPETIDEFVQMTQKLTRDFDGDGIPDVYGYTFMGKEGAQLIDDFETWLYAHGGSIFDEEGKHAAVNSPEGVEAAQFMTDLVTNKVIPPGTLSYTNSEVKAAMQYGKVAAITLWWQYFPWFEDPKESKVVGKVKIGALPQKPGKGLGYGHMGCWSLFIDTNSRNVDDAWQFLKFITSAECQRFMVKNGNGPTRASAFQSEEFTEVYGEEGAKVILDIYSKGKMPSPSPIFTQAREAIAHELHQAFAGNKTPKEAMDDAAAEIDRLISSR